MKRFIYVLMCIAAVCLCSAEEQTDNLKELRKNFYRGSLADKIEVVQKAVVMDNSVDGIFSDALTFVKDYSSILQ